MEEKRNAGTRDDFLEKFFKLQSDVQRLTEHEKEDRPKYERWYKEFSDRFAAVEKLRLETTNGRLRELENRPILVQISELRIKELFDERAEVHAGRAFIRLLLSVGGALGFIAIAAIIAYLKLKG